MLLSDGRLCDGTDYWSGWLSVDGSWSLATEDHQALPLTQWLHLILKRPFHPSIQAWQRAERGAVYSSSQACSATVWHLNAFCGNKQFAPNYSRQAAVAERGAAAAFSASCAAKKKVHLLNTKLAQLLRTPSERPARVFKLACPVAASLPSNQLAHIQSYVLYTHAHNRTHTHRYCSVLPQKMYLKSRVNKLTGIYNSVL